MRLLFCPKCGVSYERHPLTEDAQELCPACRNAASWDDIKQVLAEAAASNHSSTSTSWQGAGQVTSQATGSVLKTAPVLRPQAATAPLVHRFATSTALPVPPALQVSNPFAPKVAEGLPVVNESPFGKTLLAPEAEDFAPVTLPAMASAQVTTINLDTKESIASAPLIPFMEMPECGG